LVVSISVAPGGGVKVKTSERGSSMLMLSNLTGVGSVHRFVSSGWSGTDWPTAKDAIASAAPKTEALIATRGSCIRDSMVDEYEPNALKNAE
jgi:hypothetical protein